MENNIRSGKQIYKLYIMGCRGSLPVSAKEFQTFGGQTSCYIFKTDQYALVVDCGTGLYDAGPLLKDCTEIDVFLTHIHYDHMLGLLKWSVFPKGAKLTFHSAFKNWFGRETFKEFFRAPFWPVQPDLGNIVETPSDGTEVKLSHGFVASLVESNHPDATNVLCVRANGRKFCLVFDCERLDENLEDVVKGAEYLFYDGMYTDEEYPDHEGWGHSTFEEGIAAAKQFGVKHLYITHHSPDHTDKDLTEMELRARERFKDTTFARAGMVLDI